MPWRPSRIVTLLTDFGQRETYVGVMKGVLFGHCPELRAAIDLTHEIDAQDVLSGAFQLAHAWRWFPEGTVHVAVVDPGVGSARRIVVAQDRGHVFLAPDNGLLGPVLSEQAVVRELDVDRFALPERSHSFHGRDVFAPAAAAIAGGLDPDQTGPLTELDVRLQLPEPRRVEVDPREADEAFAAEWVGEVVLVDRFGNLISNVPGDVTVGSETEWEVRIRGRSVPVQSTYADVESGELLALVDSFGRLEVARRDGNAAEALTCGKGESIVVGRTR